MKALKFLFFLSLSFFIFFEATALLAQENVEQKKSVHLVFIRPDTEEPHPFFDEFNGAMQVAVQELGGQLDVYRAIGDHYRMLDIIDKIISSDKKPDAVIFLSMRQNGERAIRKLNDAGIKGFLVNAGLTEEQYKALGEPRDKIKHWLGEMMPDDEKAGYILLKTLSDQAAQENHLLKEKNIRVLGIEGNSGDGASIERVKGLKKYIDEHDNIDLLQIVKGRWTKETAYELTKHMFKRHGRIDVIWAASDAMAIGASQAAAEEGIIPGKDIFIGGVDWSKEGLEAIKNNILTASAGGHLLEGAWAAIVLHDYFNGHDFMESEGLKMHSPMYIADKNNLEEIKQKIGTHDWEEMNFKSFSKTYNPDIKAYNFSILKTPKEESNISEQEK